MSTPVAHARTSFAPLNRLSIAAIIFAVIAASGFFVFGAAVIAVFAVGAGHVALNQIRTRTERGRGMAITALAVGYSIAALALANVLWSIPDLFQLLSR